MFFQEKPYIFVPNNNVFFFSARMLVNQAGKSWCYKVLSGQTQLLHNLHPGQHIILSEDSLALWSAWDMCTHLRVCQIGEHVCSAAVICLKHGERVRQQFFAQNSDGKYVLSFKFGCQTFVACSQMDVSENPQK